MTGSVHRDYEGAKLGMWLFLFTELILFGGLFILYAVYLSSYPQAFGAAGRALDLFFGTVNTVVLITGSMLVAMALTAMQRGTNARALRFLGGTIVSAVIFLVNKFLEWSAKIGHGIYPGSERVANAPPGSSVFYGLYYVTTGLHGLHVLAGAILLTVIALRVRRGAIHAGDCILLENGALYWHLVDLIWIFIFPLYYLVL